MKIKKFNEYKQSKKDVTYYIDVDYIDGEQNTYNGLNLTIIDYNTTEETKLKFNTGDIAIDYIDMYKYIWDNDNIYNYITGSSSSSLDNFVMDGNKYKWIVLTNDWEQIVPKHINNLDEMKEYYRNKKKI